MKIDRYRPAYFSGFEDESAEFNTKEELESIEFIKTWTEYLLRNLKYSLLEYGNNRKILLMACNSENHYVIATSNDPATIDFIMKNYPEFDI